MNSYALKTTNDFDKSFQKLIRKNKIIEKRILDAIDQLITNPFYSGLKTHKVNSRNYGIKYSSRVTGDLRIIWDFENDKTIILALTIGGHSGGNKVYS